MMIPARPADTTEETVVGESRWPMAVAVLAIVAMTLLLQHDLITRPRWGLPLSR